MRFFLLTLATVTFLNGVSLAETLDYFSPLQIPAVLIGDPGNKGYYGLGSPVGDVATPFYLGKYEITAAEFSYFLNAVASKSDPHALYQPEMGSEKDIACIARTLLEDGTYSYAPIAENATIPVTYVSLFTAERYCNWLGNGCPSQLQGDDEEVIKASTETGAYTFSQQENRERSTFNPEATNSEGLVYYIPSETEWVKAGYYKGGGSDAGYWGYPTQHNEAPANGQGDSSNQANYRTLATGWKPRYSNPVLTPVDYFEETSSFYGCRDMGGNVAEWTTTFGGKSYYTDNRANMVVRGGSWNAEYSIFYNNELMLLRTAATPCYAPEVRTSTIGFRIAVSVPKSSLQDEYKQDSGKMEMSDWSGDASLLLWPVVRQATLGCPRAMASALLSYLFGATENALFIGGAIIGADLLAFLTISVALEASYNLTMKPSSQGIKRALPEAICNALKSTLGCGMCQLGLLQSICKSIGFSSSLLDAAENYFGELAIGEGATEVARFLPCLSVETVESCLIRMAPVIPELAIAGVVLVGLHYSWPILRDAAMQSWYALTNFL